ncbi:phosphatase PAP2 family protein [Amycolatopsis taiwanensis]|uniref:phosphatase PAP2 family protein n=1 Tax=Amycolatopsis taiwanensis TaxID=342230 RepID=UPI0004B35559|nr:phosphatase PAP2 family protein [Amycolatopsis taiwanensis]
MASANTSSRTGVKTLAGVVALLAVAALGALALTSSVTSVDLRVDQALQSLRSDGATSVFLGLTNSAQEIVGLAVLALGVVILLLRRRRWDAARLFVMAGAAWALATVVKYLFDRPRPPAGLWLMAPDSPRSFPSGHTTTATVIVVIAAMVLIGTAWRVAAIALAVVFALAVGFSRVYLGDHYPTDVLGAYLTVTAVVLIVSAFTDLPRVRQLGGRLLRDPELAGGPASGARQADADTEIIHLPRPNAGAPGRRRA